MDAYSYVMVVDSGAAPNYDGPNVTLAICKPKIRLAAVKGDLVIAFSGKALGHEPHSVRWAGVVSEKLTFEQYWRDKRFAGKKPRNTPVPDNIYRPQGSNLLLVDNPMHGERSVSVDLGGRFVLAFNRAWLFGPAAPILPREFGLRMTNGRRGHRCHPLASKKSKMLIQWLDKQAAMINFAPPRADKDDNCGSCSPRKRSKAC